MESRKALIIGFAAVIWLAVVVGFYFYIHKPVTPVMAARLALALGRVLVAGGVLSLAGGVGARLFLWPDASPLVRMTCQAALGMGTLALAIFFIGITLGVNLLILGLFSGSLAIVFRKHIANWWTSWVGLAAPMRTGGVLGQWVAGGMGLLLVLTLALALSPPLKFDTLVYHLPLPQAYLENGRITYLPWIMFWGMPQLVEMLYVWAMAIGGGEAAGVLGWMTGVITLVGLLGYLTERIHSRAAWIAVVSLLAGFTFAISLSWAYVDWFAMLCGLVFLIFMDEWRRTEAPGFLFLAAVMTGFAMGTKYTAGVLGLGGGLILLFQHSRDRGQAKAVNQTRTLHFDFTQYRRLRKASAQDATDMVYLHTRAEWKKDLSNLAFYGVVALVFASPWLIKNALATGNPFYPLLFPAGAMSELRLAGYQNQAPGWDWREVFFLPWQATMKGVEGSDGYAATLGPLLLGLGVFAGMGWRGQNQAHRTTIQNAALVGLGGLLFWAVASRLFAYAQQARLYFVIFPAFALLAGAGYANLEKLKIPGVRIYRVVGILSLLVFGLNLLQVTAYAFQLRAPQWLLGLTSSEAYLAENLGMTALAMQTIQELPAGSRVLMLWEPRSYYCAPHCTPDEILDRWLVSRHQHDTNSGILQAWRAEGFTHLLMSHFGADYYEDDPRYTPGDWQALDDLLSSLPLQVDLNQIYSLYVLTP